MIGTSSSSSTEAWLVHPEPDIWLALSGSTPNLGLVGASLAALGEEEGAGVEEEEEEAASGADEEVEGTAAVSAAASAPATS